MFNYRYEIENGIQWSLPNGQDILVKIGITVWEKLNRDNEAFENTLWGK